MAAATLMSSTPDITQQAPPQSQEAHMGTGGTSFVPFLNHVRKETRDRLLAQETDNEHG